MLKFGFGSISTNFNKIDNVFFQYLIIKLQSTIQIDKFQKKWNGCNVTRKDWQLMYSSVRLEHVAVWSTTILYSCSNFKNRLTSDFLNGRYLEMKLKVSKLFNGGLRSWSTFSGGRLPPHCRLINFRLGTHIDCLEDNVFREFLSLVNVRFFQ